MLLQIFPQQRFLENFCYSIIYILLLADKKGRVLQSVQSFKKKNLYFLAVLNSAVMFLSFVLKVCLKVLNDTKKITPARQECSGEVENPWKSDRTVPSAELKV